MGLGTTSDDEKNNKKEIPKGTKPMMISMREMDSYGLKIGPSLKDTVDFKVFLKQSLLTEIQQVGFLCPFHSFKNDLLHYQGDQILIIADKEGIYGENWILCVTDEAYMEQLELLDEKRKKIENEKDEQENIRLKKENDEMNYFENLIHEEKPMIAKAWVSETASNTDKEVQQLNIKPRRSLITMTITRKLDELNGMYKLSDRDADQNFVECRQHKDPNYELCRMEQEIGLQAIPEPVVHGTQTSWFRSVNTSLQYEPAKIDQIRQNEIMDSKELINFLSNVSILMEETLQQNETIDIFTNSLQNILLDDEIANNRGNDKNGITSPSQPHTTSSSTNNNNNNTLKELRTFTDLEYSKNKSLPAIDWHPRKRGLIAVSTADNENFSNKINQIHDKLSSSYLLLWNFNDLIHPQLMLDSIEDVYSFRFNPTLPHIIAAGIFNGQVVFWDIAKAEDLIAKKANTNNSGSSSSRSNQFNRKSQNTTTNSTNNDTNSNTMDSSNNNNNNTNLEEQELNLIVKKKIPPVKPIAISYIDQSHRSTVADLVWLPAGIEINNKGHILDNNKTNGISYQFVTVAGDGQICFWDIRYKQDTQYRGASIINRNKNINLDTNNNGISTNQHDHPFTPIYRIVLNKMDSTGDVGITKINFECILSYLDTNNDKEIHSNGNKNINQSSLNSRFLCGTEEGEMVYADWRPHSAMNGSTIKEQSLEGREETSLEYIYWIAQDHLRMIVSLERSPFYSDIYLSVGHETFHLWRHNSMINNNNNNNNNQLNYREPIFTSSYPSASFTCAKWSPTRPGVILFGKADGTIDIWDLLDQSHRPSITATIGTSAITSMEFNNNNNNNNTKILGKTSNLTTNVVNTNSTNISTTRQQQLVAAGDKNGNLHILDVPRNFSRPLNNEKNLMENFFSRETIRLQYVKNQENIMNEIKKKRTNHSIDHQENNNNLNKNAPTMSSTTTTSNNNNNNNNNSNNIKGMDHLNVADNIKFEDEYKKLESIFINELELTEEYIKENEKYYLKQKEEKEEMNKDNQQDSNNSNNILINDIKEDLNSKINSDKNVNDKNKLNIQNKIK